MALKIRLQETQLPYAWLTDEFTPRRDRFCLRLGAETLPPLFNSICVDATVKMVRRTYYEGITSEAVANINTSFVDDILAEYAGEIDDWKNGQAASGNSKKVVTFL